MSHKIITCAPSRQCGSTVFGMLLNQALTYSNMRSMFTFTEVGSLAPEYISVKDLADPTRSVMQLVKLIELGALKENEILDFATSYAKNSYIMDLSNRTLTEKVTRKVVRHVFKHVPTDVIICDDSTDTENITSEALIEDANQIFIVITPSKKNYALLHDWLRNSKFNGKKNVYVVVNYYNEAIGSMRDISRYIGLPAKRVCHLHFNPYITKCSLNGALQDVIPYMADKDPRLTNLTGDMKSVTDCVLSEMGVKRWR